MAKFYSYLYIVFPILSFWNLISTMDARLLIQFLVGALIAYAMISGVKHHIFWRIRLGAFFYLLSAIFFGFIAFGLLTVEKFTLLTLLTITVTLISLHAAYTLFRFNVGAMAAVNPAAKPKNNDEFENREFDYDYKGYKVYKSKSLYWLNDTPFRSAKDIEAHIENIIEDKE